LGFSIIDKPSVAREKRLDGQIINQMNSLRSEIRLFYSDKKRNPTEEELRSRVSGEDIESLEKGRIKYQPQDSGSYSLCAVFKQSWDGKEQVSGLWTGDSFWKHSQGEYCFEIKENLDLDKTPSVQEEKLKQAK
jgi:hypothetical protein